MKRLLSGAAASRLPVLHAPAMRPPAVLRLELVVDYSTFDLFGDGSETVRFGPLRLPVWLRRLIGTDQEYQSPSLDRLSPRAGEGPLPSHGSTDVELYRPQIQGWGVSAPMYVTWASNCRTACNAEAIGGAPPRTTVLRYFEAPSVLLPAMVDSWTERAWPLALAVEQAAHMRPIFVPERFQVGFCCGSPALAAEIIMLVLADHVEARLATAHDVGSGAQADPCDILLPLRPGATAEEVRDVIAASVRAAHTVLCAAA